MYSLVIHSDDVSSSAKGAANQWHSTTFVWSDEIQDNINYKSNLFIHNSAYRPNIAWSDSALCESRQLLLGCRVGRRKIQNYSSQIRNSTVSKYSITGETLCSTMCISASHSLKTITLMMSSWLFWHKLGSLCGVVEFTKTWAFTRQWVGTKNSIVLHYL